MADDNFLELARKRTPRPGTWGRRGSAGKRYVRTPEGAEKYGLPIGALITADAIRRAQARGRSYSVPEDSGDFGSKPPAAGRTRKDASELVSAIRNAPAPRRTNPEGPKKVAVGRAGFGFPEGSRTFRPKDHENFAIVRTPDYQLVVVTDKGIAFELDGDLERELNEELDDDASLNFNVDEPREIGGDVDVDGDGRTGESSAAGGESTDTQRPSRVEDMPGFLTEDRIQEIMDGMEQAGLDQQSRDAAELQLHRSNNRIRAEFEAGRREESGDSTPPSDSEESGDSTPPSDSEESDAVNRLVADIDREAQDAVDRGFAEPDEQRSSEPESAQERSTPRRRASARARSNTSTSGRERSSAEPSRSGSSAGRSEQPDPDEQLRALEDLAQGRSSGVAEGAVGGADVSVRRNRVNGEMEYFSGNESLASREDALERARTEERPQRDTSELAVGDLTDEELTALQADLNDFIETREFPPRRVLRRSRDVAAEIARRQGTDRTEKDAEVTTPEPSAPSETLREVPSGSPRDGAYEDLVDPEDIRDARPGDTFVVHHEASRTDQTFVVGEDGRVRGNTGNLSIDRAGFQDWLTSDDYEVWANTSNRDNQTQRPRSEPGDAATATWAREAEAGAVAYSPDGVVAERNEDGSWETPLGRVNAEFFDSGDVEGDVSESIVRTEADVDGRPVGATNELNSPEDLESVRTGDAITFADGDGREVVHATRRSDNTLHGELESGLHFDVPLDDGIMDHESIRPWRVPNQDLAGEPSQESWSAGDRIRSAEDLNALTPGTVVRVQGDQQRPEDYEYIIEPDGKVRRDSWPEGSTAGIAILTYHANSGKVTVDSVPDKDLTPDELEDRREALVPLVVENLDDYQIGDTISDYRHIRDMKGGEQVTMIVPASRNGGREMHVVLTRTDDENTLGGYMFLVGNGGRGYNSFGENNQNLYQAIADERLLFGNVTSLDGTDRQRIEGDWGTAKDIELWEGGPKVSEADLRQYIASQVSSMAMQKSYFDPSLLPENNPFHSQDLRRAFAKKAKEKYDTRGNPMRSKPASIRYASELLGMEFSEPGSALVADNLTPEDFRKKVTVGRWLRSTEAPAEPNMGPEQIEITAADIKTALAVLDNMLESDAEDDPDKILKRNFARRGSPLQNMNTSAAVAAYFGVERFKQREDGTWQRMNTIGKQYEKRRNKALFRQMLLEQLEGREPGYYGLPEDEFFENSNGEPRLNRTKLSRPEVNSDNDGTQPPAPAPEPEAPAADAPLTTQDIMGLNDGDRITGTLGGVDYDFDVDGATYVDTQYGTLYRRTEPSLNSMERAGWTFRRAESSPATDVSGITPNSAETLEDLNRAFQNGEISLREFRTRERAANLNSVSEPVSSAEDAPSRDFPMEEARRAELDRMEWDDAWRSAQQNNDALNYIEDVMGPDGVSALNDGSLSMRAQFVRAHEQANPETPEADAPESAVTSEDDGLTTDASVLANLPEGTRVTFTTSNGDVHETTATTNSYGNPVLQIEGGGGLHRSESSINALLESGSTFRVHDSGQASAREVTAPAVGSVVNGRDIDTLPVGSYVRGASGQEYRVADGRLEYANSEGSLAMDSVRRFNAEFTVIGEPGDATPSTPEVRSSSAPRVNSEISAGDLRNVPNGHLVRSRGGTEYRVTNGTLRSVSTGRRAGRLASSYTYLGNSEPSTSTDTSGSPQLSASLRTAEGRRSLFGSVAEVLPEGWRVVIPDEGRDYDGLRSEFGDKAVGISEATQLHARGSQYARPIPESSASGNSFNIEVMGPEGQHLHMGRTISGDVVSNDIWTIKESPSFDNDEQVRRRRNDTGHGVARNVQNALFDHYRALGMRRAVVHGVSTPGSGDGLFNDGAQESGFMWSGSFVWPLMGFQMTSLSRNSSLLSSSQHRLAEIRRNLIPGEDDHFIRMIDGGLQVGADGSPLLDDNGNQINLPSIASQLSSSRLVDANAGLRRLARLKVPPSAMTEYLNRVAAARSDAIAAGTDPDAAERAVLKPYTIGMWTIGRSGADYYGTFKL